MMLWRRTTSWGAKKGIIVSVFCTGKITGYARSRVPVLSWHYEQEHNGFILVQVPLGEVIALHPMVYY
jgi:hypothetical protein